MNKLNTLLKNKKILIIVAFLIFFALIMIIVLLSGGASTLTETISGKTPQVEKTTPIRDEFNVSRSTYIIITFTSDIPQTNRNNIVLGVAPSFGFTTNWMDLRTVAIAPNDSMDFSTKYFVSVGYTGKTIYSFSFTTEAKTIAEKRQESYQQLDDDLKYSKAQLSALEKYPFQPVMPVVSDKYFIVFDFDKNKFLIQLKVGSDTPAKDQDAIVQSALADLVKRGIYYVKYGYYVKTL